MMALLASALTSSTRSRSAKMTWKLIEVENVHDLQYDILGTKRVVDEITFSFSFSMFFLVFISRHMITMLFVSFQVRLLDSIESHVSQN